VCSRLPIHAASYSDRVLELVNFERAKAGVPALAMNPQLAESARRYVLYLGEARFFNHVGPDGSTVVTRSLAAGYHDFAWLGENIAAGFTSPESVVAAWMESPPHKSNILDPNYAEIGVATASVAGSPYGRYWAQEFGARNGALAVRAAENDQTLPRTGRASALRADRQKGVVSAGEIPGAWPRTRLAGGGKAAPVITSVSPSSASHRSVVKVHGQGFGASGILRFGGLVATVDSWSDTLIVARVPAGAISSGITVTNDADVISLGVGFRAIRGDATSPVRNASSSAAPRVE